MTELASQAPMTQLSDAMAAPLVKIYRGGGTGLALLWLGRLRTYLDDVDTIKDQLRQLLAIAP